MPFNLDLSSLEQLITRLDESATLSSPGPLQDGMLNASDEYHASMRSRFAEASGGDGTWQELAEETKKTHKAIGDEPAHKLRMSGALEKSLQRGDPDHYLETTDSGVIEGTQNPVARFQDGGTVNIPAREIYVPPDSDTLERIKQAEIDGIRRWLKDEGGVRTVGGSNSDLSDLFGIDLVDF